MGSRGFCSVFFLVSLLHIDGHFFNRQVKILTKPRFINYTCDFDDLVHKYMYSLC